MPNNSPLASHNNTPQEVVGLLPHKRHYIKSQKLSDFATQIYRKTGKGITFEDLRKSGLANHKTQAQSMLKRLRNKQILFTLADNRPQKYYPTTLRSEIFKKEFSKNTPIEVTGVAHRKPHNDCTYDNEVRRTLEDYVLHLLPSSPLFLHKLQLQTKIDPKCYGELPYGIEKRNKAKKHEDIIGNNHVNYLFYPSGTVVISLKNSNNPFKLENEEDRSYILTYFGQIRDRLVLICYDPYERLVPPVLNWQLNQCDINKDIRISDWLQVTGLKIQLKHLDHLFRLYVKCMGKDTVLRVEESKNKINKPVVEALTEIFNPNEKFENALKTICEEISQIKSQMIDLAKLNRDLQS